MLAQEPPPAGTTRGGGQGRVKTMPTKERERWAERFWEETRGDVPASAPSVRPVGPDRVPRCSWGQEGLLLSGRQPPPSPSTTGHKPVPVGPAPHSRGPTGAGLPEPTCRPGTWLSWTRVHRLGGQDKAHPEPASPACSVRQDPVQCQVCLPPLQPRCPASRSGTFVRREFQPRV